MNKLTQFLSSENLCLVKLKELSSRVEEFYKEGDEIDFVEVMKKTVHCLPLDVFRYLMLFVANKESKMKIYSYAIQRGRFDLLSSIRGLTTKDYTLLRNHYVTLSIKNQFTEELLITELNRAIKKEKEKSSRKNEKKYYAVKMHRARAFK